MGIAIAFENGAKFGRKPKDKPEKFAKVLNLWKENEISARNAGKMLGITHQTFLRWLKKQER